MELSWPCLSLTCTEYLWCICIVYVCACVCTYDIVPFISLTTSASLVYARKTPNYGTFRLSSLRSKAIHRSDSSVAITVGKAWQGKVPNKSSPWLGSRKSTGRALRFRLCGCPLPNRAGRFACCGALISAPYSRDQTERMVFLRTRMQLTRTSWHSSTFSRSVPKTARAAGHKHYKQRAWTGHYAITIHYTHGWIYRVSSKPWKIWFLAHSPTSEQFLRGSQGQKPSYPVSNVIENKNQALCERTPTLKEYPKNSTLTPSQKLRCCNALHALQAFPPLISRPQLLTHRDTSTILHRPPCIYIHTCMHACMHNIYI